ncbi:hypothetical protein TNCV_514851 [Trichonephila clavipes]|nr:hypothetical protein TNCV_514851 [Trichonephila clavipes]
MCITFTGWTDFETFKGGSLNGTSRGVATAVSAISTIRGPQDRSLNMCSYSSTNKALISRKEPEVILIQGPLRTSYASGNKVQRTYMEEVCQLPLKDVGEFKIFLLQELQSFTQSSRPVFIGWNIAVMLVFQ